VQIKVVAINFEENFDDGENIHKYYHLRRRGGKF
jgi:hypothetical protein